MGTKGGPMSKIIDEFTRKHWLKLIIFIFILLCFWYIWPTPYRYDHITLDRGRSSLVRINRFTGKTEVLVLSHYGYGGEWIPIREPNLAIPAPEAAAPAQAPMSSAKAPEVFR